MSAAQPQPLLAARDVGVSYEEGKWAVRGADLEVAAGDAVGIVGESGSGKSTFARTLVGALLPSEGAVEVQGRPWSEVSRKDPQRRCAQLIFQDPYSALNPHQTPIQTVAEAIRHWRRLDRREAERAAAELLGETGLSGDLLQRRPARLSGGQCQRVGIARALACEPAVLIADEPTSALDASVQSQILNLLVELRQRRGLALVLISHDLGVVRYVTERALVMCDGAVVEAGETGPMFAAPRHPYTRALLESLPGV
ncbi:MAG TPA: ABC transporter ATP-binding protein [Solirubrobacterales bacterium]|nr:ABC transporter ATP-binding protein [Solirubrobacterales bacterium]